MAAATPAPSRASSSSPVPEGTYKLASAPSCSCVKVIEVALFILSVAALATLYLLKGGFVSYTPIAYATGIISLIAFVCSCRSENEEGTRIYVQVKGQKNLVALDNIVGIEEDGTYCVPKDGSCLFHSVLASLKLLGKDNLPQDTIAMRQAVVGWMESHVAHDKELQTNLISSFVVQLSAQVNDAKNEKETYALLKKRYDNKQLRRLEKQLAAAKSAEIAGDFAPFREGGKYHSLLQKHFSEMRCNAFGTGSEIFAMTKLYQVSIHAINPYGDEYVNNGRIHLAYDAAGVHYNFYLPTPAVK